MIYRATIRAVCRLLGFDPEDVTEIRMDHESVTVYRIERKPGDMLERVATSYPIEGWSVYDSR